MNGNDFIREMVGIGEILAQLAEEAAELAQAALKYRRAITQDNPTPTSAEEALEALREEIADVDLCLVMAGDVAEDMDAELPRMEAKRARWIERLGGQPEAGPVKRAGGPDCTGACTGPGGVCPKLRPDFGCEHDKEEAEE